MDAKPEWDNQSPFCIACMTERDAEGKCKCPPPPSIADMLNQMMDNTWEEED